MSAAFPFDGACGEAPGWPGQAVASAHGLDESELDESSPPVMAAAPAVFGTASPGQAGQGAEGASALPRAARDQTLPLSYSQQREWNLARMESDTGIGNITLDYRIKGKLDLAALARSLQALVRRHEALRTTFALVGGTPRQRVVPEMALPLSLYDLRGLVRDEQEQRVENLRRACSGRFDLTQGPLIRAGLIELRQAENVFLLSMHRIICDAWSLPILQQELAALYGAFAKNLPVLLPVLCMQYADYAVWQRACLHDKRFDSLLNYWCQQLDGASALPPLPTDRPRTAVRDGRSARHRIILDAGMTARLHMLAGESHSTLFTVLQAAYAMLLSWHASEEDICVGTFVANRTRSGTEKLIGCFANSLVLRTRLRKDFSFEQLLADVQTTILAALAHQELPFERLIEALEVDSHAGHTPLFQAVLAVRDTPARPDTLPGLEVEPLRAAGGTATFDLSLACTEKSGQLHCVFDYSSALFDGVTIERMADRFMRLLDAAVAQPSARLDTLEARSLAERSQQLDASMSDE